MDDWRILLLLVPFAFAGVYMSEAIANFRPWAWRTIVCLPFGIRIPVPGFDYVRHLAACGENPEGQLVRPPQDIGEGEMVYRGDRPGRFRVVWQPPQTSGRKDVKAMLALAELREASGDTYLHLRVGVDLLWPLGMPLAFALCLYLFESAPFAEVWPIPAAGVVAIFAGLATWAWLRQRRMAEHLVAQLRWAYARGYRDLSENAPDRDWYAWLTNPER